MFIFRNDYITDNMTTSGTNCGASRKQSNVLIYERCITMNKNHIKKRYIINKTHIMKKCIIINKNQIKTT